MPTPLSVLDLSPVTTGTTGAQALRNTLDLARHADRLGFTRYWVAEHHNLPSIASSAPDIMIGQIAAVTDAHPRRLRRRDAAEPRAARWSPSASRCWKRCFPAASISGSAARPAPIRSRPTRCGGGRTSRDGDDFLERFQELLLFEQGGFPDDHPFRNVRAMPADVPLPPIYLLGSSDYSAQLAAHVGAGFSFAHHFSDFDPVDADDDVSRALQAVADPRQAACDPRLRMWSAPTPTRKRSGLPRRSTSTSRGGARATICRCLRRRRPRRTSIRRPTSALVARNRSRLVVGGVAKVMTHLEPLIGARRPTS